MVIPKKATTQLAEFSDFINNFTRNLLEDDEPVPIIRQMMVEAGYIDYIKESAATPAQEKPNSIILKCCIAVFRV